MTEHDAHAPAHDAPLRAAIVALANDETLDEAVVGAAFDVIMRGNASPVQVAALLTGLRVRGETAAVIAGAASALRRAMTAVDLGDPALLVDTCGTGGGRVATFNISTAAALVAAGAGVPIAKHGNRSFTSRSGSADVLEALGIEIDVAPEAVQHAFEQTGIVFMYAPRMHPAMRHVGPVRRELAVPTVMNVVGPLANPARAARQVVGVADATRAATIADALARLDTAHALVVHGAPGMDELSPLGVTSVYEIRDGRVTHANVTPDDLGCAIGTRDELAGGSPEENAEIITGILTGRVGGAAHDAVVMNAAAAIYVGGRAGSLAEGADAARAAISDGSGIAALERLRAALPRR